MISYTHYNNAECGDICVAMCFFNPLSYKNNLKNIQTVVSELKKTNIPFYIIELIYPGQSSSIPAADVVVKGSTYYFVKENLWNILEKHIPDNYEKIVFLDCDVLFTDPDWINKISNKLSFCKAVHASEYFYRDIDNDDIHANLNINKDELKVTIAKAVKNSEPLNTFLYNPGYHVCLDRNFFHKIGGFFDKCPVTIGDTLFWSSFSRHAKLYAGTFFVSPNFKEQKEMYKKYKENVLSLSDPIKDVDFIENNITLHMYHGTLKNRNYGKQFSFIPGPFKLWYNKYGVLEIEIIHPVTKDLKSYFEARKEDGFKFELDN